MLDDEDRIEIGRRRAMAGRDEPGRRVEGDEVVRRGLSGPYAERDEPGRGRGEGDGGDTAYGPPMFVTAIPW